MKKALIIAYDFPPYVSVGGLRPYSWYIHMSENSIYPIVITRQWNNNHGNEIDYISQSISNNTIIEKDNKGCKISTPYSPNLANKLYLKYGPSKYKLIRKLISGYYEVFQFLFNLGPKSNLYKEAFKYLKNNEVDIIIASGEPFVLFKYASKLSRKFKTPWIADYRDPWTQDKNRGDNLLRRKWDSILEKKYLKNVTLITTVSETFKNQISTLITDKSFSIITNGFDSNSLEKIKCIKQNKQKLNIGFVGTIYKWHPIESFLNECEKFITTRKTEKFRINFYGINNKEEISNLVNKKYLKLKKHITFYSKIPNQELLIKLANNNLLLLFNYYSYMGTKIYDYIALKRKIILCYTNDKEGNILKEKYFNIKSNEKKMLQEDLLKKTNSGIAIKDAEELQLKLNEFYDEFLKTGKVLCESTNTDFYSRKVQTKNLCKKIHQLI